MSATPRAAEPTKADPLGPVPIVIQPGTALYRLVRKIQSLQTARIPSIITVKVEGGIICVGKFVPDGLYE